MKRWLKLILAAIGAVAVFLLRLHHPDDSEMIAQHDDLEGDDGFNAPSSGLPDDRTGGGSR